MCQANLRDKFTGEDTCEQCVVTVISMNLLKDHLDRKTVRFRNQCDDCGHKISGQKYSDEAV